MASVVGEVYAIQTVFFQELAKLVQKRTKEE